jgi:hypothetical protein
MIRSVMALMRWLLLLVHFALGHVQQGAMAATIATTDARVAYEAQRLRQSVLFAHANMPGLDRDVRAAELGEAAAMGQGKGIGALRADLEHIREGAEDLNARAHGVELAEAALQLAILLVAASMAASLWVMRIAWPWRRWAWCWRCSRRWALRCSDPCRRGHGPARVFGGDISSLEHVLHRGIPGVGHARPEHAAHPVTQRRIRHPA